MRRVTAAAVLAVVAAAPAARAEPLPSGSLGAFIGGQAGVGASTDAYGVGFIFGMKAAWQPMTTERRIGWGITWSLLKGWFDLGEATEITGDLDTLELSLGVNVRLAPELGGKRFLVVGAGGTMLRSNVRLPPDDERLYVGPYGSLGIDQYILSSNLLLSAEARYGLIGTGPDTLAFFFGASLGI